MCLHRLALVAGLLAAAPSLAQTAGPAFVFGEAGYAYSSGAYGLRLPGDRPGDASMTTVTLGGEVPVARVAGFSLRPGAALRLIHYRQDTADGEGVLAESSGLQHLDLHVRADDGLTTVTAGFSLDLGPDPLSLTSDGRFYTSDVQHALYAGVASSHPLGPVRVSVALDGYLTFLHTYQLASVRDGGDLLLVDGRTDAGNTVNLRVGASRRFGAAEVGLDVLQSDVTRSETTVDLPGEGPVTTEGAHRWLLSLAPYVRVAPPGTPLVVELAARATEAAWYLEHVPVGFTVAGGNAQKVRVPLSLRVQVGL